MAAAGGAGGPGYPAGRKFVPFTWPKNDRNYIFHPDGKYWCLKGTAIDPEFPREGRDHKLWGIDFPIDAMLNWGGYSYVFSGKRYWRLNAGGDGFDRGYPQPISAWGVEGPIDAALNWNGRTYFFVGKQYYRINKGGNGVDAGYPMSNKAGWGIDEKITGAYNDGSRVMFLMTGEHAEWCTPTNVSTGMPDGKITYTHTSEIFNTRRVAARDAGFSPVAFIRDNAVAIAVVGGALALAPAVAIGAGAVAGGAAMGAAMGGGAGVAAIGGFVAATDILGIPKKK